MAYSRILFKKFDTIWNWVKVNGERTEGMRRSLRRGSLYESRRKRKEKTNSRTCETGLGQVGHVGIWPVKNTRMG